MGNIHIRLMLSASIVCLASGCAAGPRATLEIRNVDQSQLASTGQRSIDRGKELLQRGQYADAISSFRTALREEPDAAEANNGLAIAYDGIGRTDLARRYFELAVAEKPDEARYRNNLARFFEKSGQPELALGLLEAPAPPVAVAQVDAAFTEETIVTAPLLNPDPITSILADLSGPSVIDQATTAPLAVLTIPAIAASSADKPTPAEFAVYKPAAPSAMIEAVQLKHPAPPAPDRAPFEERIALIADLPRNDRKLAVSNGPHIERVSLGEVRLVTLPLSMVPETSYDFESLGQKLSLWAEAERRRDAFDNRAGLKGRLAIQNAIERAAVAEAIASLVTTVEQMDSDFAYTSFAGDADVEGTAAA